MKLSVSLPDEDVEFLDAYATERGVPSRSAVLHQALALLRASKLGDAYTEAWDAWASSDDAALWDPTAGDGIAAGSPQ